MSRTYGAQQYAYQILTAVVYALENRMDNLAIEGPNFEDSCFSKNGDKTIGEAKYVISKRHWTPRSLFYEGEKMGPLLQLWNRWSGKENLVLFSPIPESKEKSILSKLTIPSEIKLELVQHVKEKFPNLRDLDSFLDGGADLVLKRTWFVQISFDNLVPLAIELADMYGVNSNKDRVSRLHTFFSSDTYEPGRWISLESMLAILAESREKPILTGQKRTFKDLLENRLADKVYFSLIWPKSVKDCSKFAFGENGLSQEKAVLYTIRKMHESNYVKEIKLEQAIIYKSTHLPVYEYCRKNIIERSEISHKLDYDLVTSQDRHIFESIFYSDWFSQLLKRNLPRLGVGISSIEGLHVYESLKVIADFVEVLCQIAECFSIRDIGAHMPSIEDYDLGFGFDSFCNSWIEDNLSYPWIDSHIDKVFNSAGKYLGAEKYPSERMFLDSVKETKNFLCIPKEFASKMTKCHRIQSTIAVAFCRDR